MSRQLLCRSCPQKHCATSILVLGFGRTCSRVPVVEREEERHQCWRIQSCEGKKSTLSNKSETQRAKKSLNIILPEWATAYSIDSLDPNSTRNNTAISLNCLFVLGRLLKNTKVGLLSSRELLIGGNTFESNFDCELSLIRRKLRKWAKYSCRARLG